MGSNHITKKDFWLAVGLVVAVIAVSVIAVIQFTTPTFQKTEELTITARWNHQQLDYYQLDLNLFLKNTGTQTIFIKTVQINDETIPPEEWSLSPKSQLEPNEEAELTIDFADRSTKSVRVSIITASGKTFTYGPLTYTFARTEELRIISHTWNNLASITVSVTNTGSAWSMITAIRVNSVSNGTIASIELKPGDSKNLLVFGSDYFENGFSPRTKYEFLFITESGGVYNYVATTPS